MRTPIAIVFGSLTIAGAILWAGRWEVITPSGREPMLYDHRRGHAYDCSYLDPARKEPWRINCN
jgi:hypothetical protein